MNKTKTFSLKSLLVGFFSIVLLASVGIFMSACNEAPDKPGTLENVYTASFAEYDDDEVSSELSYELKYYTNGFFEMTNATDYLGKAERNVMTITGNIVFDKNGNIQTGQFFSLSQQAYKYGKLVKSETWDKTNPEMAIYNQYLAFGMMEIKKFNGAVLFGMMDDNPILLQTAAKPFKANDTIKTYTEKELVEAQFAAEAIEYKMFGIEAPKPNYVSDFAMLQTDQFDLSTAEGVEEFLEDETYAYKPAIGMLFLTDDGSQSSYIPAAELKNIVGLDLSEVGLQTVTLTFENAKDEEVTKTYSIYVYADKYDMPLNKPTSISYGQYLEDSVLYIEKGTEFYADGYITYRTVQSGFGMMEYDSNEIPLNVSTTDVPQLNPLIQITGFDKTVLGFQEVTITFKGQSTKVMTYVWDAENNPVLSANIITDVYIVAETDAQTGERVWTLDDGVVLGLYYVNGSYQTYENTETEQKLVLEITDENFENFIPANVDDPSFNPDEPVAHVTGTFTQTINGQNLNIIVNVAVYIDLGD